MGYDNRPNISWKQFCQCGGDYMYYGGHNCICGTGGTISSNSGYQISGATFLSAGIGLNSTRVGCNAFANSNANAVGAGACAQGVNSISIGCGSHASGNSSIAIGKQAIAFYNYSTVIGCENTSRSLNGNILGGYGNTICSGNTNVTLVGGYGHIINANCYSNTVIVPSLAILNPSGSGNYLCWDNVTKKVNLAAISEGVSTANNGLNVAGSNVRLGGALTGNTIISGAYSLSFCNGAVLNTQCGYQISGTTMLKTPPSTLNSIYIGSSTVCSIYIGYCAGANSDTAPNNIGIGKFTLCKNCNSGTENIAIGLCALCCNTIGYRNIAIGCMALANNLNGASNVGIGVQALYCNFCGVSNVGIGTNSLNNNTCGCCNVAIGYTALNNNTYGCQNVAIGTQALSNNTTGKTNIGIGTIALYCNICGNNNIGIGTGALTRNINGSYNVALGYCAGFYETGSNKLYIANNGNRSLIYGEFDNEKLCIRGKTYISGLTNSTKTNVIYYDTLTKELTYGATPSGGTGGITWNGSTANAVGTYGSSSTIDAEPNLTFDGTKLGVTGNVCATTCVQAPILQMTTGAAAGCILTSNAAGCGIWSTPTPVYWTKSGTYLCPVTSSDCVKIATNSCYSWVNGAYMVSCTPSGVNTWCLCINANSALEFTTSYMLLGRALLFNLADASGCQVTLYPNSGIFCSNNCITLTPKDSTTSAAAFASKIYGGNNTSSGAGGDVWLSAGNNSSSGVGGNVCIRVGYSTTSTGGNLYIDGANKTGGSNGRIYMCGLPAKTSETCGIYIDASNRLSYGIVSSGGTGGSGITGATNLGSGNGTIYTSVSACKLNFKTLSGGTNITLTCNGNYIGINASGGSLDAYSALTSGATVTWNTAGGLNKTLNIATSFTLSLTNLANGMSGDLRINNTTTTTITITLPTSKLNGTVTGMPAGIYHLTWIYTGSNLDFSIAQYV